MDAPSLSAVTTNQGFRSGKVPGSVLVQAAALSTRLRGVGVGCNGNGNGVDAQLTRLLCRLQTNLPICRRVLSCVGTVPVASPAFAGRAWHSCSGTAIPISACCATSQRCSVGGLERHLRLTAKVPVQYGSTPLGHGHRHFPCLLYPMYRPTGRNFVAVHYLSPFSNVFDTLQDVPDRQDICSHKPVPNARGLTDN